MMFSIDCESDVGSMQHFPLCVAKMKDLVFFVMDQKMIQLKRPGIEKSRRRRRPTRLGTGFAWVILGVRVSIQDTQSFGIFSLRPKKEKRKRKRVLYHD